LYLCGLAAFVTLQSISSNGRRWPLNLVAIGACHIGFVDMEFRRSEIGKLQGRRAMAWLENNLLGKLRLPHCKSARKRRNGSRNCRAGSIPPSSLTGICFDEETLALL
jgi:hypothetical protein